MKISHNVNVFTIRKKILLASKLIGVLLAVSYVLSAKLPVSANYSYALWMVFVVVLIIAVDLLMGRFISKPIAELNEAAWNMAKLDFSHPCGITSLDELGELSKNLNIMAANLQQAFAELEEANGKLEQDVEQKKRLLAERKELVDNLSHEMKTPLGVIRAYAEGLQDETDEPKRQKYAQVIISEAERMNGLIVTLLDLSALETGASQLTMTRFDFVELVETVAGRLLIDPPDTDFTLQYELPAQKIYVRTDKRRMEQVLDNLIVNARKNVRPDGVLRLELTEDGGVLHFSIFNQGRLIPENDLPKIWTKFHRGSSAVYSGSGLGLSIVAQILSMQGLPYGAENLTDGVRFTFSIPAAA